MSCISNNFSSFFLDSLNDPSEFAKYLGNAEHKMHSMDDFYYGTSSTSTNSIIANNTSTVTTNNGACYSGSGLYNGNGCVNDEGCEDELTSSPIVYNHQNQHLHPHHNSNNQINTISSTPLLPTTSPSSPSLSHVHHQHVGHGQNTTTTSNHHNMQHHNHHPQNHQSPQQQHQQLNQNQLPQQSHNYGNNTAFDGTFEFSKYLRHSEYGETITSSSSPHNMKSIIDLDSNTTSSTTTPNRSNSSMDIDNFIDHHTNDSKQHFDLHNESSSGTILSSGISNLDNKTSNSNTSLSEYSSDNSNQANQNNSGNSNANNNNNNNSNISKPLTKFMVKENFDVHPAHKVEEGIFQHMNKLPNKKKDTLKQLGVTFTGHMSISEKSIIVDNFARFCEEYGVTDHRPFLTLNQSGMLKQEQIKFARYLGQGLPNFTLFCIYSNFKNLFCTKRFENYVKGSYNLHYILDKTKRFLTCTTNDLKNLTPQQISEGVTESSHHHHQYQHQHNNTKNGFHKSIIDNPSRPLETLVIFENYDVHPSHRIEDGIFTHMSRLSPKKQEFLKQFGIQSNQNVSYQEKLIIIENFMKFCNEYSITDHRFFLDFHDSGLPKIEQIKFVRFLGQGLPNLTLYKIYSAFKDLLALNRIDKLAIDGYNLEVILKKKKKNLLNRISAIACKERQERNAQAAAAAAAAAAQAAAQAQAQSMVVVQQPQVKLERITS